MKKQLLVVALTAVTLAGCANNSSLSGDVYSASQAKQIQSVSYGTIVSLRPVKIQSNADGSNLLGAVGGAVLGGLLGNAVGQGTGRTLATAAGAIAGGMAGQAAQGAIDTTDGVELQIRRDDGNNIVVVQKGNINTYSVGEPVKMVSSGGNVTVSARY